MGIREGDVVCAHSSFDQFLGFTGTIGDALRILQDAVGPNGGLMMPTQPFSGSAIDYIRAGKPTNIARTPSRMGMITELLRRTKGAVRSTHPTHPVALWGARAISLADRDWEATTPCGRGTAYARLLDVDGKILLLGTGPQPMTFYHHVEELIEPLLPFSPFTSEVYEAKAIQPDGTEVTSRFRMFEPTLSAHRQMAYLVPELRRMGAWTERRVGRLQVILLRATDVAQAVEAMARRGEHCYGPSAPVASPRTVAHHPS